MRIALIGGSGKLGKGLVLRWRASHEVTLGSRDPERARPAAKELGVEVGDYAAAAAGAEVVILTIPFAAHRETAAAISGACGGKVVIDTTVPLSADRSKHALDRGSAAEVLQSELLPFARIVSGFHSVAAGVLADAAQPIEADIFVCGDDEDAKKVALRLAADLPARGFDVGALSAAGVLERLTPLLIGLNKRYHRKHIGLRLSGI